MDASAEDELDSTRAYLRSFEERPDLNEVAVVHDDSADEANDRVPVLSENVEDDESDSTWSSDKVSTHEDEPFQSHPLPVRQLGLSRRAGWSSYSDYDVITVHGVRDDHQTAWTAWEDGSDWIEHQLFRNLSIRQLDYVYDTGSSARIHDPGEDGITTEANALLETLAQDRYELPSTETHRPIIWICHDLGGSIVKKALVNAIHNPPEPGPHNDAEDSLYIRNEYKRLPLLTTSIIFLSCPHGNEPQEELEDQLFALMSLPGPPMGSEALKRIANLTRQIEIINLEFLETKILDHAVIVNITTAAANSVPETVQPSTENDQVEGVTNESQRTQTHLFSMIDSAMLPDLAVHSYAVMLGTDHLELVKGPPLGGYDWAWKLNALFNYWPGFNIKKRYGFLAYQNSLLSLSPPTRVRKYNFASESLGHPPVMSWILEQNSVVRHLSEAYDSRILYLHAGRGCSQALNINLLSQQLCTACDLQERAGDQDRWHSDRGLFYFEFDEHDSRQASIKDMIVSFMSAFAGRFWNKDHDHRLVWTANYLRRFRSWSLRHLINAFLDVQSGSMREVIILLGGFDRCEEKERSIFLQSILNRHDRSELLLRLIMTTNKPDGFICDKIPPSNVISLEDCPLPLEDYLAFPSQLATQDRIKRLLIRRPDFTHVGPELSQIMGKFRAEPDLQDKILQWLTNYKCGSLTEDVTKMARGAGSPHQELVNSIMDQLSVSDQGIMKHIYDWIKYASEPPTLEILVESLGYTLPPGEPRPQRSLNQQELSSFVEQVMGGVILRDGRDLKFSDDAFYDASAVTGPKGEQDQVCRSHASIATACLRYLLGTKGQEMLASLSVENQAMDDLSWSPISLPRHSLVSYALLFWTVHYRAAGDYRPTDLATELLRHGPKRSAWIEAVYVASNPFTRMQREYISSLPYMAMFGLDDLVRLEVESEEGQNSRNHDHWLAIAEASLNGHGSTVALLLECTDMDATGLGEALHCAARYGEGGALDCLISKAQQLERFSWPPGILAHAVLAGLENLVLALVKAGHDLNEPGYEHHWHLDKHDSLRDWRAVHIAIAFAQDKCLKILLDSGRVDIELKNNDGRSPLVLAARFGTATSIRHLLDAGASPENHGGPGTLLYETLSYGNPKALEVLIDAKVYSADLLSNQSHSSNSEPFFPLIQALQYNLKQSVRILLDNGADPNVASEESGSALYLAVDYMKDIETCRVLLEKGADPNESTAEPSGDRGTLLSRAIGTGIKLLVETLIDHGAEIDVPDPSRDKYDTPLLYAIFKNDYEIMKLLLERGANPNLFTNKWGCCPPLFSAVELRRDTRFIETLIQYNADIHWTRSVDGVSVLHAAYASADTLSLLLRNGANINATTEDGDTTLMMAVAGNMQDSVEVLLKQTNPKADLELMCVVFTMKHTALHIVCEYYDADVLKLLLEAGADVNRQRGDGKSPLAILLQYAKGDCEDAFAMILKRRPDLEWSNIQNGETILHQINSDTPLSVVMRLVEEGAPVNNADDSERTPLVVAVSCENLNVARYLTTVKGVQCNLHQPSGSILHDAARWSLEMVKQLIRTGADPALVAGSSDGDTVLHSAIRNPDRRERRKIIRYLVEEVGLDVNAPGGGSVCPLELAISLDGDKSLVKYLLQHGALLDQTDKSGRTVAHWATRHERLGILKLCIELGADLSVADNFGRTPLHQAAAKRNVVLVKYILENLPQDVDNVNIADVDGWTPLMWAIKGTGDMDDITHVPRFLMDEYKADARVRSKDGKWSALKLTAFLGNSRRDFIEDIAKRLEDQGAEEGQVSEDREAHGNADFGEGLMLCGGCFTHCYHETLICPKCEFAVCFKCVPHRELMHDEPKHSFVDIDLWYWSDRRELAAMSDDGGESAERSENEERTESETEEEDDDDEEEEEEEEEEEGEEEAS